MHLYKHKPKSLLPFFKLKFFSNKKMILQWKWVFLFFLSFCGKQTIFQRKYLSNFSGNKFFQGKMNLQISILAQNLPKSEVLWRILLQKNIRIDRIETPFRFLLF